MICAFIVSIDDLLFRRNRTQCELLGLNVVKVPGIPWHEVTRDQAAHTLTHLPPRKRAEKYAIRESMKRAAVEATSGGIILQEDWTLSSVDWDGNTFTLFGGEGDNHWCPQAFAGDARLMGLLADAWSDESVNACQGWRAVLFDGFEYSNTTGKT